MVSNSPGYALGSQADGVRDLMVDVVRTIHERFAAAHLVSGSKYGMGFGSQWRDLLDEACDALTQLGFESHKLPPGGHRVGVVNGCLVYVWRVPEDPSAVKNFASSPTRQNGFVAPLPPAMLWEPNFDVEHVREPSDGLEPAETATMMAAIGDPMPVVLVLVHSVPWQLQSIEWAVAELDTEGEVQLRGRNSIWEPELAVDDATSDVEAFDSGTPAEPVVELQAQERPETDA